MLCPRCVLHRLGCGVHAEVSLAWVCWLLHLSAKPWTSSLLLRGPLCILEPLGAWQLPRRGAEQATACLQHL